MVAFSPPFRYTGPISSKEVPLTLGEKLQNLRTDAGMSQEDLADRLGVSRQAISKWELGKTVPDVKYIVALSDLFQVTTDYLLKEPAAETPPEPQ